MDENLKKRLMDAMMELPNKSQVSERNSLPVSEEDELAGLNAMNRSPISDDESMIDKINRAARLANLEVKQNPEQYGTMGSGIKNLGKSQLANKDVFSNLFGDIGYSQKPKGRMSPLPVHELAEKYKYLPEKVDPALEFTESLGHAIDRRNNPLTGKTMRIISPTDEKFDDIVAAVDKLYGAKLPLFDRIKSLVSKKDK